VSRSDTGSSLDRSQCDGGGQGSVVTFVLLGVRFGEVGNRVVESVRLAEVGRDCEAVA
jgi:hypothetical protein